MKKILTKILEEINKVEPRLDYIRGLIEASIEEETIPYIPTTEAGRKLVVDKLFKDNQNVDEEIIPEFVKAGPIGKITS